VLAAIGAGVTLTAAAAKTGGTVTFSSVPATANLLTHYVVSAADRERQNTASANAAAAGGRTAQEPAAAVATKQHGSKIARSVSADVSGNRAAGTGVAAAAIGTAASTPPLGTNFIGQQSSATTCSYFGQGCNPPDMALASSSEFVLQGVNTQWAVWDTSGAIQDGWPVGAQAFFGVPNVTNADGDPCDTKHLSQPFLSDPRAVYDPVNHRFWAAMLQIENGLGIAPDCPFKSVYYVAVSQTNDPRGNWNVYEFEMSLGKTFAGKLVVADYTQLGFDGQAVYFTANMFTQDGLFYAWAELFEANKATMESGLGGFDAAGFYNLQASGPASAKAGPFIADTLQPAMNLDPGATGGIFVDTFDGPDPFNGNLCGQTGRHDPCSGLALWSLTIPTVGPPALTGTYVATQPYLITPHANQPSCNRCIDSNDLRIPGTPVIRNGILYAAWGTAINSGSQTVPGIQWAQVSVTGSGIQEGYYFQSGDTAVTYPTLMPDTQGNVFMLFERMGSTVLPEARFISKAVSDANFSGSGASLKDGESSYRPQRCGTIIPVCRWGDYEAASIDGQGKIWVAGEYANNYDGIVAPAYGRNWGTWIGVIG
jgi:hypothetical protein